MTNFPSAPARLITKTIVIAATALIALLTPRAFNASQTSVIAGRVLDSATGQVIPCIVEIASARDRAGSNTQHLHFRSAGQFYQAVPPGAVTVVVSRGFDYLAQRQTFNLRPAQHVQLIFRLRRQADLRRLGWYCGDNHVHMIHGTEKVAVNFSDVALAARAAGLDYMSVAQNWNLPAGEITPAHLATLCKRASTPNFILTWNMEAPKNYWRGDVSHCLGHCWTLGMQGYTTAGQDVIRALFQMSAHDYESEKTPTPNFESQALIHSLGGIVVYSHPCRWGWGKWGGKGIYPVEPGKLISNLAQELPYDTIVGPTYDGIDILMQSWDRENYLEAQSLWFLLLNKGYRIPGTASTDASFDKPESAKPGIVRVYTHAAAPLSIAAIARAMKAGKNFVTSGPLLLMQIDGHQPGDVITLHHASDFQVQLQAWPSGIVGERLTRVELIRNGEILKQFVLDGPRKEFRARFSIHETGTAWYIARCFGSTDLQVAITNPIYLQDPDYQSPQPTAAYVTGIVTSAAGKPLDGEYDVIRMVGLTPVVLSRHGFSDGRFIADVPGTARLQVRVPGYKPMMKSVFMDYQPLLRMALDMREAELTDWRTFREIKELLRHVDLKFQLTPSELPGLQ
ncbi:MAG TPA: CehA/McbA family metallohydrolase [Terriglobia bacterium]|nr:CehA/McbA family metallohydrolase [Terriglobia bacterium]